METPEVQSPIKKKDLYLYGDISQIPTEELKSAYRSYDNEDIHERVEGELLARKAITLGKDYARNEQTIDKPTKKIEGKRLMENMN